VEQVDWEKVTNWTEPLISKRLKEIQEMGWIKVSDYVTIFEDGQVGQSIERLFHVPENNLEEADLQPNHELKSIRLSGNLTLKHGFYSHTSLQRGALGSGMIQYKSQPALHHALLEKYGHIHKKRNSDGVYITNPNRKILNDETTYNNFKSPVRKHKSAGQYHEIGDDKKTDYWSLRPAKYRFVIYESSKGKVLSFPIPFIRKKGYLEIHHRNDGYIATVSIDGWSKLEKVVLCICDSNERSKKKKTRNEEFRLVAVYLLEEVHSIDRLLKAGLIGEFSIAGKLKDGGWKVHQRGDHYRISLPTNPDSRLEKLSRICKNVRILISEDSA
jgi:hypothetical protein